MTSRRFYRRHGARMVFLALTACCLAAPVARAQRRFGCEAIVYIDANFQGPAWRAGHDAYTVPPEWNDQISSIRVIAGVWEFFYDWHYEGELLRLRPGNYPYVGDHWNDQISSFRCVQPTG